MGTALLLGLVAQAKPTTLTSADFTADLPESLRKAQVQRQTVALKIVDRSKFEVRVHYDQLVSSPDIFRKVEVDLPESVPGTRVSAALGHPVNLGTTSHPIMAVPLLIQWSGEGWLRTDQWTLSQGKLSKNH